MKGEKTRKRLSISIKNGESEIVESSLAVAKSELSILLDSKEETITDSAAVIHALKDYKRRKQQENAGQARK